MYVLLQFRVELPFNAATVFLLSLVDQSCPQVRCTVTAYQIRWEQQKVRFDILGNLESTMLSMVSSFSILF